MVSHYVRHHRPRRQVIGSRAGIRRDSLIGSWPDQSPRCPQAIAQLALSAHPGVGIDAIPEGSCRLEALHRSTELLPSAVPVNGGPYPGNRGPSAAMAAGPPVGARLGLPHAFDARVVQNSCSGRARSVDLQLTLSARWSGCAPLPCFRPRSRHFKADTAADNEAPACTLSPPAQVWAALIARRSVVRRAEVWFRKILLD